MNIIPIHEYHIAINYLMFYSIIGLTIFSITMNIYLFYKWHISIQENKMLLEDMDEYDIIGVEIDSN